MGKELLIQCLNHEKVERAPWVPFAGIHAGKLLGYSAIELLTDEEKLVKSLLEVNKLYRPDGQPILFDLQVEAEILGCELHWSDNTPPTVKSHPLSEVKKVPCDCKIPSREDGRLPMILNVMKKMKEYIGETTALYGLVCGPLTLASHLRGTEIFMDMFDDEEFVLDLLGFCNRVSKSVASYYIEAGMDVIAIVDPLVSQISKRHFKRFLSQVYTDFFTYVRDLKAYSSFFVCGDATKNIEVMCETNPDSISVDENINIVEAKQITDGFNVVLGGNIPLTTVMLHGSQQDNMKCVVDIIENVGNPMQNFIVSPGCDMPYDVPVENAIGASLAVLEFEQTKKMVDNYEKTDFSNYTTVIPDYQNLERPLIEVFTLDSDSCAACTYMWGVASHIKRHFGVTIDVVEYKYTDKENIARCIKMRVKNLPSLYINGKLKYSSIIPKPEELIHEIEMLLQ